MSKSTRDNGGEGSGITTVAAKKQLELVKKLPVRMGEGEAAGRQPGLLLPVEGGGCSLRRAGAGAVLRRRQGGFPVEGAGGMERL